MRWNGNSSLAPGRKGRPPLREVAEAFADDAQHREDTRALDDIGEVLTAAVIGFIAGALVAALCMVMLKWPPV